MNGVFALFGASWEHFKDFYFRGKHITADSESFISESLAALFVDSQESMAV